VKRSGLIGGVGGLALLAGAPSAFAAPSYTAIYSFGDSLSDVGNVQNLTSTLNQGKASEPAPPYANGQFNNGSVWVQDLSQLLGLAPLQPSQLGGTDYAWGGATTGYSGTLNPSFPVPTLTNQVDQFLQANPKAPSSALYTVSIGSNDVLDMLSNASLTPTSAFADLVGAAQTVATDVTALAEAGAQDVLLMNVPDLGKTPEVISLGAGAASTASGLSSVLNELVSLDLAPFESGLEVFDLNAYGLVDLAVSEPSLFGLTDVTDPCYVGPLTGGGSVCSSPNSYLFWDNLNPTAFGHAILADYAINLIGGVAPSAADAMLDSAAFPATVPEPSTWAMMLVGFAGLGYAGYRRAKSRARDAASPTFRLTRP
jgi:phospholipase/lecithinase/hemolysin